MAQTLVPSRKVRRRAAFTLVPLAAIAVAAGCGGGGSSPGSSAGTTADYVPASAPLYVEVDSDTQSAQWQQVSTLLDKFPGWPGGSVDEVIEDALMGEQVSYEDLRPILGESVALALPRVPRNAAGSGLRAPSVDDTSVLVVAEIGDGQEDAARNLLTESGAIEQGERGDVTYYATSDEDAYSAVLSDAIVVADSEESLFASLDANASGGDSVLAGASRFRDALAELPEDVFAQGYLGVGELLADVQQDQAQLQQFGGLDDIANASVAASLTAEADGFRTRGVIVGADQIDEAAAFTPTLADHAPADSLAYIGFADLQGNIASVVDSLRESGDEETEDAISQVDQLSSRLEAVLGISVSDLAALTNGEHAIVAAPDSSSSAQVGAALLLRVEDGAQAQQTLDALRAGLPTALGTLGQTNIPDWEQVQLANGISGWELPVDDDFSVVYAVDGDLVIIGTSVELVRKVQSPATPLSQSQRYLDGTSEAPSEVTSIAWIDIAEAVQLGGANDLFQGEQELLDNLRPLESLSAWSTGGDTPTFDAFLRVP